MRLLFYSLALLLSAVSGDESPSTSTVAPVKPKNCVHIPASACPPPAVDNKDMRRCRVVDADAVVCCHIQSKYLLKEALGLVSNSSRTKLHIRNATLPDFNVSEFSQLFRQLVGFAVTDGHISHIVGEFPSGITCLNLSDNALVSIEDTALASLHGLEYLDIARNNLTQLPAIRSNVSDIWLDLAGSNQFRCSHIDDTVKKMAEYNHTLHFAHERDTYCNMTHHYNWFNSTERVPLLQVEVFSKLSEECPQLCICSAKTLVIVPDQPPTATVSVDCSGRNLTELPEILPQNTSSLNVSNNNISSLARLVKAPSYQNIREFYADNNQISSITILEGSSFITNFDILALRRNAIKIIPTYILSNTFDEHSGKKVKLGHNQLTCDCNAALTTKVWLMANDKYVCDFDEVMCDNSPGRLIDLDKNNVCTEQRVWTDYIYYIIAGEVALLFLLVAKVTYDYWVFKTAGYLPWPASKMPKLPCDWVFET